MVMSKDVDYVKVLAEELRDQRKQILEALDTLKGVPGDLKEVKADVKELKSDMQVVKAAIKDQGRVLNDHEKRITVLETT